MHNLLLQVGEDSTTTTSSSGVSAGAGIAIALVSVVVTVFYIVALWRVFTKAGEKGWKSLIPIWNLIVILRIAGRPWWWLFLFIIPLVNIVVAVIVYIDVAKAFARSAAFGVGLALLGFIFLPILAFGGAEFQGVTAARVVRHPAGGEPPQTAVRHGLRWRARLWNPHAGRPLAWVVGPPPDQA